MSHVPYAGIVGSLMYATICIIPYLTQVVNLVSRYMSNRRKED